MKQSEIKTTDTPVRGDKAGRLFHEAFKGKSISKNVVQYIFVDVIALEDSEQAEKIKLTQYD